MKRAAIRPYPWLRYGVFVGALAPLFWLIQGTRTGSVGADPIAVILNQLGLTALVILVASLFLSPLQSLLKKTWPLLIRRMVGMLAFFYMFLHVLFYMGPDKQFDFSAILDDVTKRPFIMSGMAAFLLLVPLAWTSRDSSVKKMGQRRWQKLHYLVYPAVILAVVHFYMRVKIDTTQPLTYGAVVAALLSWRLWRAYQNQQRMKTSHVSPEPPPPPPADRREPPTLDGNALQKISP